MLQSEFIFLLTTAKPLGTHHESTELLWQMQDKVHVQINRTDLLLLSTNRIQFNGDELLANEPVLIVREPDRSFIV